MSVPPGVGWLVSGAAVVDVSTDVLGPAAVVLVASFVPLLAARGDALSIWLSIPLVAAVVATYLIGRLINRRFLRIVRALKHNSPVSGDPFR